MGIALFTNRKLKKKIMATIIFRAFLSVCVGGGGGSMPLPFLIVFPPPKPKSHHLRNEDDIPPNIVSLPNISPCPIWALLFKNILRTYVKHVTSIILILTMYAKLLISWQKELLMQLSTDKLLVMKFVFCWF